jgi:hypothetical protein
MMPVADLSYRDDLGGNVAIYPHGYALRVKFNMERQDALEGLSALCWAEARPSRRTPRIGLIQWQGVVRFEPGDRAVLAVFGVV